MHGQRHSCVVHTVNEHFAGKDSGVREIYDRLILELQRVGPVRVEAVKSCIHLASRFTFAGVYVQKKAISLEFASPTQLTDPRISKSEQISAGVWHNTTRLTRVEDVDPDVVEWLQIAYRSKA